MNKRALRAYRVKRMLLGQSGAPLVTWQTEFWRFKAQKRNEARNALDAYVRGRTGDTHDVGWGLWTRGVAIRENRIWASPGAPVKWTVVGRIYPRLGTVVVERNAPRWLRNWAKTRGWDVR